MLLFGGEVVYKEDLRDSNDPDQSNSTMMKDDRKETQAWTQEGQSWFRKDMPLPTRDQNMMNMSGVDGVVVEDVEATSMSPAKNA